MRVLVSWQHRAFDIQEVKVVYVCKLSWVLCYMQSSTMQTGFPNTHLVNDDVVVS
jgi:hypothetical protein